MEKKFPHIEIKVDQCKGCMLCIENCPSKVISLSTNFNIIGYQYAEVKVDGCTGCEACFYACPEPSTITVVKERKQRAKE